MRHDRRALLGTAAILATLSTPFLAQAAPPLALPPAGASRSALTLLGAAPTSQQIQFDVVLPLGNPAALDALLAAQQDPTSPQFHKWLKPSDFAARFGPSPVVVQVATHVLQLLGFQVTPETRSLHVTGTVAGANAAFGTSLSLAADLAGNPRLTAPGPLALPPSLAGVGALVSAFSPSGFEATTLVRRSGAGYVHNSTRGYGQPASSTVPTTGYFYNDLKQAYGFPSYQATVGRPAQRLDGTGTTVAVVMSSDVLDTDIAALFDARHFTQNSGRVSDPKIFARRPVNGGMPFSPTNPTAEEATLDVEQVLGGAPGANVILYDTPDLSDQSLVSALAAVVNDDAADVVSMSFGQCELNYTAAYNGGVDETAVLGLFSELFKQGNAEGMTFIAASGDGGAVPCLTPGYYAGTGGQFVAGVNVPAADPDVTAVGGANLVTAATAGGAGSSYARENAWSDPELPYDPFGTGVDVSGGVWGASGGVSTIYARPAWQASFGMSAADRAVPDVGMEAGGCPDIASAPCNGGNSSLNGGGNTDRSSLNVVFDGDWDGVVGTSAAAPAWASAVALMVEAQGRQGNLNPMLYALAQSQRTGGAGIFNTAIPGFNGAVASAAPWSQTTGLGTPNVAAVIGLSSLPLAGLPGSASNP